jgi:hypothetical protein
MVEPSYYGHDTAGSILAFCVCFRLSAFRFIAASFSEIKLSLSVFLFFVEDRRYVSHSTGCYLADKLHFRGKEIVHLWSAPVWKLLLLQEASRALGIMNKSFCNPVFLLVRARTGKKLYKNWPQCLEVK